ncbi:MAG: nucleotidyltransferase domain-containing protein [Anaerolineales bacterium]|nr:nucleotidyltransferase domain-containing protein [Anaerolineales bacterium]
MSPKPNALRFAKEYRRRLSAILKQPIQVILFGSQARGDAVPGSDIDLFVVLPNLEKATLDTALDVAWEIGFEAGVVLSVIPATKGEFARLAASPFYQAVQREGVAA